MELTLIPLTSVPDARWLSLRHSLWPEASIAEHEQEMLDQAADAGRFGQFLAVSADGVTLGLCEVSLRLDYVNGTETSPVAFLEGLYVMPEARRRGVARRLLHAVRDWARARGCSELASDALIDNHLGQSVHLGLGFRETERVVCFNMALDEAADA